MRRPRRSWLRPRRQRNACAARPEERQPQANAAPPAQTGGVRINKTAHLEPIGCVGGIHMAPWVWVRLRLAARRDELWLVTTMVSAASLGIVTLAFASAVLWII